MTPQSESGYIVIGLANVAKLFGVTPRTIQNWIRKEGFPAARLPSGTWAVTLGNINLWLAARQGIDPYSRDGETPKQFQVTRIQSRAAKAASEIPETELQAILEEVA